MTLHYYARSSTGPKDAFRRWLKQTLSRESVIDALKTLSWLAPLTLLIWVYAERQQTDTPPNPQVIPIEVVGNDPNRFVQLQLEKNEKSITAQLTGPNIRLQEISRQLFSKSGVHPVEITVDSSIGQADGRVHELDTALALSKSPLFKGSGVSIVSCRPTRVPIFVDEYQEREAEVQLPPGITNLEPNPVFSAAKVIVRGPKTLFPEGPLVVYADVAGSEFDQPGRKQVPRVELKSDKLPPDKFAFKPSRVDVSFEVRRTDDHTTIRSVPIRYECSSIDLFNQYKIKTKDVNPLTNVTVIGPQDKIEAIKSEQERPVAVLHLSREDVSDGTWRQAKLDQNKLKIELPPGVTLDPDMPSKSVDYQLVDKSSE